LILEVILGAEIESSPTNPGGVRITTQAFLNLFISVLVGIGGCGGVFVFLLVPLLVIAAQVGGCGDIVVIV
jgi:hypothetical protein